METYELSISLYFFDDYWLYNIVFYVLFEV